MASRRSRSRRGPFADQVAVITGGSRGLGFILAREFGRRGARVAICSRTASELEVARVRLEREGIETLAFPCDLRQATAALSFVHQVSTRFRRIDILVNNAGIIQVGPARSMGIQDYEQAMESNFWSALRMVRAALPHLRQSRRARIVNITSIGGAIAVPHLMPYTCSKFGMVGLSLGLRAELAREKIRVVTVLPGLMRTGSFFNALFKGDSVSGPREFGMFSLGAALPLISMDAERAARRIVTATRYGEAFVTLGLPAKLARLAYALAPGLGADALGFVNRYLPEMSDQAQEQVPKPGKDLSGAESVRPLRTFLVLGEKAAEKFNEK